MKFLISIVVAFLVGSASMFAQDDVVTADQLAMARKLMSNIDAHYLRSGEDQNASAVILESKLANESAFAFLLPLPGYQEAVDSQQLIPFMEEARKEYKEYKKLSKEAEKAKKRKWDYMSSIDEEYRKAVELYEEAG